MNNWTENNDDQAPEWAKELRKQYKKSREENEELKTQLSELLKDRQHGNLAGSLARLGANPEVAKFYPAGRPIDDTSISEWYEENKAFFVGRDSDGATNSSGLSARDLEDFEIIKDLRTAQAFNRDYEARIKGAKTADEVMEILTEAGGRYNSR